MKNDHALHYFSKIKQTLFAKTGFRLAQTIKIFLHFRKPPVHENQFGHRPKLESFFFSKTRIRSTTFFFVQILSKRALQHPQSFFYSANEMIDPKWHQSTIRRVPYTELRSQRATEQNYVKDIVKSGINFFFFQF